MRTIGIVAVVFGIFIGVFGLFAIINQYQDLDTGSVSRLVATVIGFFLYSAGLGLLVICMDDIRSELRKLNASFDRRTQNKKK